MSSPPTKQATAAQPIAPGIWSNKTTTPATLQNAPRIPAPLVQGVSSAADATQLGVKVLESWKKNPISQTTLDKVDRTAGGVSAITSGIGAYQAYRSGDRLGAGINAAQAVASGASALAGSGASAVIRNGAPLVGTVGSMAGSAQSLGTALGNGNRWNLDKGIAVGAAATEFVGKSAAAGAGYLIGGTAGANTAVTAADVALGAGKWVGDKFTDTQTGKRLTDGSFHIKTNEDRAAQYDRQIEAIRAQRIINGQ
ncbi:MAG: hypothetical protein K8H87_02875 [Pseudorhodoplanes sp.]|nr:hypothetical protein [Pseudorhodoplanes sp.]